MFQTGLILVSLPGKSLLKQIDYLLRRAEHLVDRTLFVNFVNEQLISNDQHIQNLPQNDGNFLQSQYAPLIPQIYKQASSVISHLDVRVLLGSLLFPNFKQKTSRAFDIVITNCQQEKSCISEFVQKQFSHFCQNVVIFDTDKNLTFDISTPPLKAPDQVFRQVCLGGTFDRIHNGHKIFLSEAVLRCSKELIIGVTDGVMLKNKILSELILPVDERISHLHEFLHDVNPMINYRIVPIYDPFGPSIQEPELDCLVVSQETLKGGNKVNEVRIKNNFKKAELHVVSLLEDEKKGPNEEEKVSSSTVRMRLLGNLLRHPKPKPHLPSRPYLIGLTGGIASGKSTIANHLGNLGAAVLDCDKLSHETYLPGTNAYHQIVKEFGESVLDEEQKINRKTLSEIVFKNDHNRLKLTDIVWPNLQNLVKSKISELTKQGVEIIVLEAAMLLEANWHSDVHEVWVTIIPENEALLRISKRDGLSENDALQRIKAQMSNQSRVAEANVVFSSRWEVEYTKMQVQKAWSGLNKRLKSSNL